MPAFDAQLASERTRGAVPLDVRTYDWSSQPAGWIINSFTPPPTTAQTWPATLSSLPLSYRTADRGRLDVRGYEWSPQSGWLPSVVDRVTATWAPVFASEAASFRTGDHAAVDVRLGPWSPDASPWILAVVSPTATPAQIGPALQQALAGFRTADGPRLDVRRFEWLQAAWLTPVVDKTVATWAPIWAAEVSYRTPDQPRLDVRSLTREPQIGWWAAALAIVVQAPAADVIVAMAGDDVVVLMPADDGTVRG